MRNKELEYRMSIFDSKYFNGFLSKKCHQKSRWLKTLNRALDRYDKLYQYGTKDSLIEYENKGE